MTPARGADAELEAVRRWREIQQESEEEGVLFSDALHRAANPTPSDHVDFYEAYSRLAPDYHGRPDARFLAHIDLPTEPEVLSQPLMALVSVTYIEKQLDEQRRKLVEACRRQGRSWADIGDALGVTRQTAWERYSRDDD